MRIENRYITKVRISVSPINEIEAQPINKVEDLSLSDIMLDYIQGQYSNLGQAYEAFNDELNRRIYEMISQYQPPSPPDPQTPVPIEDFQELMHYIGDLRY